MTRIPPEHTAAKALEDSFRELGEQRHRAARRRRLPRGSTRILVVAITVLMVAAVAATGSKVFLGDDGTVQPDRGGVPQRLRQSPNNQDVAQARAADPAERYGWGMRTYTGVDGDTCLVLGQVVGGRIGRVQSGRFSEFGAGTPGLCNVLGHDHIASSVRSYGDYAYPGGRTIFYGIVDRTVRSLRIVAATGQSTPVAIASDGTFIVVRKGPRAFRRTHVSIEGTGGRAVRLISN